MLSSRSGPSAPGSDGHEHRRAGLAADPAGDLIEIVAVRRLSIDRSDDVAHPEPRRLGRTAREDPDDQRSPIRGRIDPDADPDIRARQLLRPGGTLFGREERGVARVADRLRQAFDRTVGQGLVVQLACPDIVVVEDLPGLSDQGERVTGSACGWVRGRPVQVAHSGRREPSDPDPNAECQRERQADDPTTDRRPASTAGRRGSRSLGGPARERGRVGWLGIVGRFGRDRIVVHRRHRARVVLTADRSAARIGAGHMIRPAKHARLRLRAGHPSGEGSFARS